MTRLGILSDTHGLLRERAVDLLTGCDHILHAGDVGAPGILEDLGRLAPVTAVRGNVDTGAMARLPASVCDEIAGLPFAMIHRREDVANAWWRQTRLIVFGHSHRPEMTWQGDCLLLNPGAAGQRRFRLPLTLAIVTIVEQRLIPEILSLEGGGFNAVSANA